MNGLDILQQNQCFKAMLSDIKITSAFYFFTQEQVRDIANKKEKIF